MILEKITGAVKEFRAKVELTFWAGKIETEPHPESGHGCDALPIGWTEIAWEEFAKSHFFYHSPIATAWSRTKLGDARMFFMHDEIGYALIGDSRSETVKVFRFGCKHVMKTTTVGRCLTRYTCESCGFTEVTDSSD